MVCLNLLELRKGNTGQSGQSLCGPIAHPPFIIRQSADKQRDIIRHTDLAQREDGVQSN
jgi:hypothetical protein